MNAAESSSLLGGVRLIVDLWPLLALLASLVFGAAMFFLHSRFATRKDFEASRKSQAVWREEQEEARDAAGQRLAVLEVSFKALPSVREMEEIRLALERLSGRLDTVRAELKGQAEILSIVKQVSDRTNLYLMERGK